MATKESDTEQAKAVLLLGLVLAVYVSAVIVFGLLLDNSFDFWLTQYKGSPVDLPTGYSYFLCLFPGTWGLAFAAFIVTSIFTYAV